MDPFYTALSLYRRRKYEECVAECTELLEKNPYDQVCITVCSLNKILVFWVVVPGEQHEHPGCEMQLEGRTDKGRGRDRAVPREKGERILTEQIAEASRTPTEGKEEKYFSKHDQLPSAPYYLGS
jgi:hypothetical protein